MTPTTQGPQNLDFVYDQRVECPPACWLKAMRLKVVLTATSCPTPPIPFKRQNEAREMVLVVVWHRNREDIWLIYEVTPLKFEL